MPQSRALIDTKVVVPMHHARMRENKSERILKRERRIISYIALTQPNDGRKKNTSTHRGESA